MTQYQGKRVVRSDGKGTRLTILEAALTVILEQGLRNVKHRSVALEAGVTLGSTTYYFKDIHCLIQDAFVHYMEGYDLITSNVRNKASDLLNHYRPDQLQQPAIRQEIIETLSNASTEYLVSDETTYQYLMLYHIFRGEAVRNETFAAILNEQNDKDLESLTVFFHRLGTANPQINAAQLLSLHWFLIEQIKFDKIEENQKDYAYNAIKQSLSQMILPQALV